MSSVPKYYGVMYLMGTGTYGVSAAGAVRQGFTVKLVEANDQSSPEKMRDSLVSKATAAVFQMALRDKLTYEQMLVKLGPFNVRVFWVYGPLGDKFARGIERYAHRERTYAILSEELQAELMANSYPVEPAPTAQIG